MHTQGAGSSSSENVIDPSTGERFPRVAQGKVRDVYDAGVGPSGSPRLLVVASDRISAFDVVMPTSILGKGALLTKISNAWFDRIESRGLSATHRLPAGDMIEVDPQIADRAVVVRRCEVIPVECVARGYLEGSGWKDYRETGSVCGVNLPSGLEQAGELPEPIFTPATKAQQGAHDENIGFDAACAIAGADVMEDLRARTLAIYNDANAYARERGIIIADTKFEFGYPLDADGNRVGPPVLIDEALTPDSSRFWPADEWSPGRAQMSYDKQFVREYLQALFDRGEWDKTAPGPELPAEIIEKTLEKYRGAHDVLFGVGA